MAMATAFLPLHSAVALTTLSEWKRHNGSAGLLPSDEYSALGSALPPGENAVLAIGFGYQKCGTTFINGMLREHDKVFAYGKENHYLLGSEVSHCEKNGPPGSMEDYITDCFRGRWPQKGEATFDFTPSYGIGSSIGDLVKTVKALEKDSHGITLRFIVALREPVARAASAYNMKRKNQEEGWADLTDADIDQVLLSEKTSRVHRDGEYAEPLAEWLKSFPKDSLLIVNNEHLNDYKTWTRIYSHLGLAVPKQKDFQKWLNEANSRYASLQKEKYEASHTEPYVPSAEVEQTLGKHYKSHNQKLWTLLGVDPWWPSLTR
eukprot:CAMPEP_0170602400 /NCGR_PEP_ID=MMETSP0224-20130122/18369_1 /TAXON_ID=285029 /ORGANISM="Togula jolla, Strain CCCM 725" /LENGTH=318 /DNA_ID=CAMNT_0010927233 /DNA_START=97 /DNA_END=1053 /DNA_ORIENTATION=+